jgi:hypothetical protein
MNTLRRPILSPSQPKKIPPGIAETPEANRIGRIGSIVAPILGGYLLSIGLPPTRIFLSASLIALVAATATALLALRAALDSAIRSELLP